MSGGPGIDLHLEFNRILRRVARLESRTAVLEADYSNQAEELKAMRATTRRSEPANVQVTTADEIEAVVRGDVQGEVYDSDGECWASRESLEAWRKQRAGKAA